MDLIVIGIVACEVGFWVVLSAGLVARYLFRRRRLSSLLLLCAPVLDLLLLALIAWDLVLNGAKASFAHGLGAVYLGFTVAFGHQVIARVDAWVAHRFAGGPQPVRPPKSGLAQLQYEWREWLRMLLCAVVASAVLLAMVWLVGDAARTIELWGWLRRVWLVTGVWLVGWPIWLSVAYVLRPQAQLAPSGGSTSSPTRSDT